MILQPADERERRKAICAGCEFIVHTQLPKPFPPIDRCGKCGCPIVTKVHGKAGSCPAGKW